MAHRRSLTSQLYRAARPATTCVPPRGPGADTKRVVRRKTYRKSMGATGRRLRIFGLK